MFVDCLPAPGLQHRLTIVLGVDMIEIFEGRLGGGKTYCAVERMVKYLASGGCVYTNISVKPDSIRKFLRVRYRWDLQPGQLVVLQDQDLQDFHRRTPAGTPESPTLVVLDEVHLWFNARDHLLTDSVQRELIMFLSQSRKQHTDIIFISQSALNIDPQFRRLAQYVWTFRDLRKMRLPLFMVHWPFAHTVAVQWDYNGKTMMRRTWVMRDSSIYNLYDTFVLYRTFPRLQGAVTDFRERGRLKRARTERWIYTTAGLCLVIPLCFVGCARRSDIKILAGRLDRIESALTNGLPAQVSIPPQGGNKVKGGETNTTENIVCVSSYPVRGKQRYRLSTGDILAPGLPWRGGVILKIDDCGDGVIVASRMDSEKIRIESYPWRRKEG